MQTPHTLLIQGLLIVSLMCNAVGLATTGALIDRGARVLMWHTIVAAIGCGLGFATFQGVSLSLTAAWGLTCMLHFFVSGTFEQGLPYL